MFELVTKEVKVDFDQYIKNFIFKHFTKVKNFKISLIENPDQDNKKNVRISNEMLSCFDELDKEKVEENYFLEDDEKSKKDRIEQINKLFDRILSLKEKHILLMPNEVLSQEKEDVISQHMSCLKLDVIKSELADSPLDRTELDAMLEKEEIEFDFPIFVGDDCNSSWKRILIVSHSGFIMEMLNVITRCKGLISLTQKSCIQNCSISVLRVYCYNCNGVCTKMEEGKCKIEFDFVCLDNNEHLQFLK